MYLSFSPPREHFIYTLLSASTISDAPPISDGNNDLVVMPQLASDAQQPHKPLPNDGQGPSKKCPNTKTDEHMPPTVHDNQTSSEPGPSRDIPKASVQQDDRGIQSLPSTIVQQTPNLQGAGEPTVDKFLAEYNKPQSLAR